MSLASLEGTIVDGDRILLDSSVLIAYLDGSENTSQGATYIIDSWVRTGRNRAVVSVVSVMELLVRPLRLGAPAPYQSAIEFLTHFPNLEAIDLTVPMAQEAASLRALWAFAPPDALTIATGLVAQVSCLVTNDEQWKRLLPIVQRVRICYLPDHAPFS